MANLIDRLNEELAAAKADPDAAQVDTVAENIDSSIAYVRGEIASMRALATRYQGLPVVAVLEGWLGALQTDLTPTPEPDPETGGAE